jgi:hypothetical protein
MYSDSTTSANEVWQILANRAERAFDAMAIDESVLQTRAEPNRRIINESVGAVPQFLSQVNKRRSDPELA